MKRYITNKEIRKELNVNCNKATEIIKFCNNISDKKGWYSLGKGKCYRVVFDKYVGGEKL